MKTYLASVKDYSGYLQLSKRQKIIIASILVTLGLIVSTQTVSFLYAKFRLIFVLGIIGYLLSLWALWEGMSKSKALILLILPTLYTVSVTSFYFLLPIRWLTRLPIAVLFAISIYTLLLSQNVFNVASLRTIPLYRAASTSSFLFTIITSFFLYNVVFALNLPFYWNGVVVAFLSFLLIIQVLWSVKMEKITGQIITYSLILGLLIGEGAVALSFWPVAPTIWSLALSTYLYILLGVVNDYLRDRLNKRHLREYIFVAATVLTFSFLVTSWSG
ncbi:MAG: hypothetical protein US19_C0008G0004 [Candidatus Daviesbacteria bacterium GW2011_GWB1_36_5]|uniref:Uncharacterized protein n=1 Tax=Candidatus Daviesbacteria bacterium GW2011_GWB1_36_5 TaxID=1618426 RepID=A0A0G0I242_9BACT|nr:MAG: hypothetical protein US19_C0008G0004 [Candidatus Daviesbacteria bacterium GW2011_GWB1_36_5]